MTSTALGRRLGTGDAVVIGLGSMIGAGVFAVWGPAARAAGSWLLIGLAIAAVVAVANALSSAQLAVQYPVSGGTYVYGRERLGAWAGFAAGWSFVVGKSASCAAMALTFASYLVPSGWLRPAAVVAVVLVVGINLLGVTRTAAMLRVLVIVVLAVIAVVIAVCFAAPAGSSTSSAASAPATAGVYGVLQSAGLLFFAFAGYARVATLGEEVREPRRTVPRALIIALAIVLAVYSLVAVALLRSIGVAGIAASPAAVSTAVAAWPAGAIVVGVGAALASLGALLALVTGLSRTALAMARNHDLPSALARIGASRQVPWVAELALGALILVAVTIGDIRSVIGFSSFGVLLYYLVANLAAVTQSGADRWLPRATHVVGAAGCLILMATLPPASVVVGASVVLVGLAGRAVSIRIRRRTGIRRRP